jgi:leucine dehydrogenase
VIDPNEIFDIEYDIYAPCALGATINDESIPKLKCEIIAGAANNQLKDEEVHGKAIREKGILYAPDFLINAGGLMNVGAEAYSVYNEDKVTADVEEIYNRMHLIFDKANAENLTNQAAAIKMAEERIAAVGKIKSVL